jgi:hypothetical protein
MKSALSLWLVTFVLGVTSFAAAPTGPVVVVPLDSEVSRAQFYFLRRALKEAERQQASAFIIEMDTYGGDVKAAIDNMDALMKTTVPTYTYINPRAISAGSMISLATQQIYMSPTAVIGASAPVMGGGQELQKTMQEKTVSMLSAIGALCGAKERAQCGHRGSIYQPRQGGEARRDGDRQERLAADLERGRSGSEIRQQAAARARDRGHFAGDAAAGGSGWGDKASAADWL